MDKEDVVDIILQQLENKKTREEVMPFVEDFYAWTPEDELEEMDAWDIAEAVIECASWG